MGIISKKIFSINGDTFEKTVKAVEKPAREIKNLSKSGQLFVTKFGEIWQECPTEKFNI
jgi:hypothetical protein